MSRDRRDPGDVDEQDLNVASLAPSNYVRCYCNNNPLRIDRYTDDDVEEHNFNDKSAVCEYHAQPHPTGSTEPPVKPVHYLVKPTKPFHRQILPDHPDTFNNSGRSY